MSQLFDLGSTPIEGGVTVIEASAGTGKTFCLTGLVLRALLEGKVGHAGQLLVVTFTNAATDELVGRIRSSLATARDVLTGAVEPPDAFLTSLAETYGDAGEPAEILRRALLDIDELTVATIHGFCKRVLDEAAFEGGLPFEASLVESDESLWLDAARDVWRRLLASEELRAGEGLLPVLLAENGLKPESYRQDYRDWQRHPDTRLLPEPIPVAEAAEQLAAARGAAATTFDRARWRLALSRARRRGELADARHLREILATADAFFGGRNDAFWAVKTLHPENLWRSVDRSDRPRLESLDGMAELSTFFGAVEVALHAVRGHVLHRVIEGFAAAKGKAGSLAFDDLLHQLRDALRHPRHGSRLRSAVRSRYRVALIDEFQDTDLVQYDIFKRLFGDGPLILVGDPKQAIYRFRGADIYAYLRAKRDSARAFTLNRNWRSSDDLVAAVNALFTNVERPFIEDEIPYPAAISAPVAAERRLVGDGVRAFVWLWLGEEKKVATAQQRIAATVAAEVASLLNADPRLEDGSAGARELRPADIAVLVRTNEQARLMQDRLREVGVPAVLSRTGDIFRSEEMAELIRLLAGVLDPTDAGLLRAACSTILFGDDAARLHELNSDDALFQRRVELFDGFRTSWHQHGFVVMMEKLLRERSVRRRLASLERGERRLTNLQHAVEIAHQATHDHHLSPAGLLGWLRVESAAGARERSAAELRLESDDAAVQLVTVHKSKGLEYEVVFCPFLWQARSITEAPVLVHETSDRVLYDCGSPRLAVHLAMAEAERLAEDLRLLYVALTRGRRRTYVVWGAIGRGPMSAKSALAYLLHQGQRRLETGGDESAALLETSRRVADAMTQATDRQAHWLEDLRRLCAEHPEVMDLRELDPEEIAGEAWTTGGENVSQLEAARFETPEALRSWRIASFSSLARAGAAEVPDHADPSQPAAPAAPARGLFAFARGPRAGDCLHKVLEEVDFTDHRGEDAEEAVRLQLERFRLDDPHQHVTEGQGPALDPANAVLSMLGRVLGANLPGGLRLAEVPRSHRLVEWQFFCPLNALRPEELGDIFRRHSAQPWTDDYADRLDRLDSKEIEGFLTGYIDVVVNHRGRWSLVDWKSNHLGNRFEDYDQRAMTQAMVDHHYLLQAHLYTLALDRYLALHQPGWDLRRDFAGAYYLFLRGVRGSRPGRASQASPIQETAGGAGQLHLFGETSPVGAIGDDFRGSAPAQSEAPATGVFHLRPEPELIEALGRRLLGEAHDPSFLVRDVDADSVKTFP